MVINNLRLFNGNTVSISIAGDKINSISECKSNNDHFQLHFDNAIAFPGLINSHDHLDFNLFPMLGNEKYNNYTQWGNSIHKNYKTEINEVLKIPEPLRVSWGIYKNLLCGVTTVVNHGKHLPVANPLINIFQSFQSLHSVKLEKYWKLKLNNPFRKNSPCVIHAGEGTDKQSEEEIDELIQWNFLKRDLIAVHGVAMNERQAKKITALVWCPASNHFLLNRTASVDILKHHTEICFGTDSTLTGDWNIWEHIRAAKETGLVNDTELLEMVTSTPANVWKLNSGIIAEDKDADIVIAKAKENSFNSFYKTDPQDILLVISKGNILLFDESLKQQLNKLNFKLTDFYGIKINSGLKYISGNLPQLIKKIKKYQSASNFPINIFE